MRQPLQRCSSCAVRRRYPKEGLSVLLLALALAAFLYLLSGCAPSLDRVPPETAPSDGRILLESGGWPENSYTASLPRPESGRLETGWIDPDREYCYLALSGIDDKAAEDYLGQLYEAGFQELEQVSEAICGQDYLYIGSLLSDGRTELSLSHQQDRLGIYIHPVS